MKLANPNAKCVHLINSWKHSIVVCTDSRAYKTFGKELLRHLFGDIFLVHTLRQLLGYYLIKVGIFIHITNSCQ